MATKRKTKRFADGGDSEFGDLNSFENAMNRNTDNGEWARGEDYGDGTTGDERVAMARKTGPEASAAEVMAANKFAAKPKPKPRPAAAAAPIINATLKQANAEVKSDIKDKEKAMADKPRPRVGRAGQAAAPDVLGGIKDYFKNLLTPKDRGHGTYKGFDGAVHRYKSGGSASSRGDGIAKRGKTRGKLR